MGPGSLCCKARAQRAFLFHFLPLPCGGRMQAGLASSLPLCLENNEVETAWLALWVPLPFLNFLRPCG